MMYANISEEFPCLSRAEFLSLMERKEGFRELLPLTGIELFELKDAKDAVEMQMKSSTVKSVGVLHMLIDAEGHVEIFTCPESFGSIEVRRIQGMGRKMRREEAKARVERELRDRCGAVRAKAAPEMELYISEGLLIAGSPLSREGKGEIMGRNPHSLPFYKPGALNPWYARLLVNLSSPERGGMIYDPFCGTGTIPIAASELWKEMEMICSDIRRDMCAGAKKNLEVLSKLPFEVVRADASQMPFREKLFQSVVSDPPYDRSVRSLYSGARDLLNRTIEQLSRLMKSGGRLVISVDEEISRGIPIPGDFEQKFKCLMYVHNRLTRAILVMERK
ncbi:MAG: TRM11 family SAM-dependent methyltransferase [Fervidicoccaceae archaeon]